MAPGPVLSTLRAPLEAALARAQDVDRPATSAAAEALAGLLASGAAFEGGGCGGVCVCGWLEAGLKEGM